MTTQTKILIGVGSAIALSTAIFFGFTKKGKEIAKKILGGKEKIPPPAPKKQISEEEGDKIPIVNQLVAKRATQSRYASPEAAKEAMKKNYDYLMKKSLAELEKRLAEANRS